MRWFLWILAGASLSLLAISRTQVGQQASAAIGEFVGKLFRQLIEHEEGLRLQAYQDQAGHWTIGYGHKILPGDGLHPYSPVREISLERAEELLQADSAAAIACVAKHVTVPLSEAQRAALESFTFNFGCSAFFNSRLRAKLNAGDYAAAADELDRWVNVRDPGTGQLVPNDILIGRRAREKELFLA